MKAYTKLVFCTLLCAVAAVPVLAGGDEEEGYSKRNMRMETFFPVPYAAYDSIDVTSELQLGLGPKVYRDPNTNNLVTEKPHINIVKNVDTDVSLNVTSAAVIPENGPTVTLNNVGNIFSGDNGIWLGNSSGASLASFQAVSVGTFKEMPGSVTTPYADVLEFRLYPGKVVDHPQLPSVSSGCGSGGTVGWQKFTIDSKGTQKWFLACGTACTPTYAWVPFSFGNNDWGACSVWPKSEKMSSVTFGYDCFGTISEVSVSKVDGQVLNDPKEALAGWMAEEAYSIISSVDNTKLMCREGMHDLYGQSVTASNTCDSSTAGKVRVSYASYGNSGTYSSAECEFEICQLQSSC